MGLDRKGGKGPEGWDMGKFLAKKNDKHITTDSVSSSASRYIYYSCNRRNMTSLWRT